MTTWCWPSLFQPYATFDVRGSQADRADEVQTKATLAAYITSAVITGIQMFDGDTCAELRHLLPHHWMMLRRQHQALQLENHQRYRHDFALRPCLCVDDAQAKFVSVPRRRPMLHLPFSVQGFWLLP